jgi:hypothetical protein
MIQDSLSAPEYGKQKAVRSDILEDMRGDIISAYKARSGETNRSGDHMVRHAFAGCWNCKNNECQLHGSFSGFLEVACGSCWQAQPGGAVQCEVSSMSRKKIEGPAPLQGHD